MTDQKNVAVNSFRGNLDSMSGEIEKLLPESVPVERFKRVALTAIMNNSDLQFGDQKELFNSLLKCAQDGLLPDGREAAVVMYKGKPSYLPMIGGVLKRLRNTRELKSITVEIIRKNDKFRYWVDDSGPHVVFEPDLFGDRGEKIGVFCVAYMLNGGSYVEVMNRQQLQEIKNLSKAANGPWKTFPDQMEKKTVVHRLSNYLPLSSENAEMMRADDHFVDLPKDVTPEIRTIKDVEKEAGECESKEEPVNTPPSNTETEVLPPEEKPVSPKEEKKPEDQNEIKMSRKELGAEILKMSKELGWDSAHLATWVKENFQKQINHLTNEEMLECGEAIANLVYTHDSEEEEEAKNEQK